jgi:hypothetical protein
MWGMELPVLRKVARPGAAVKTRDRGAVRCCRFRRCGRGCRSQALRIRNSSRGRNKRGWKGSFFTAGPFTFHELLPDSGPRYTYTFYFRRAVAGIALMPRADGGVLS